MLSRAIDELEPTLTRNGYDALALTVLLKAKPAEVHDFLAGTLATDRTREFTEQLRVAGVPVRTGPLRSLTANVSTTARWRARPDDGEHSVR